MPTLEWIGKEKVINHDKEVPYKLLDARYTFDQYQTHSKLPQIFTFIFLPRTLTKMFHQQPSPDFPL